MIGKFDTNGQPGNAKLVALSEIRLYQDADRVTAGFRG